MHLVVSVRLSFFLSVCYFIIFFCALTAEPFNLLNSNGRTGAQTDGRHQVRYLPASQSYAVNNETREIQVSNFHFRGAICRAFYICSPLIYLHIW